MSVRPSPIAGAWYPGDPEKLKKTVGEYIAQADISSLKSNPIALISPHAGYTYSGSTAGHAFKTVQGSSYDLVAVVSPYHSYHPDNVLVSSYDAYATPIGNILIDRNIVDQLNSYLENSTGKPSAPITREKEHSLEIILPFLQVALSKQFELLPIMLSGHNYQAAEAVGEFLAQIAQQKNILMVASTDLSHFHNLKEANQLDSYLLEQFVSMDQKKIIDAIASKKGEACGVMAVLAVLTASKLLNAKDLKILKYTTSAEITGDRSSVVGYTSAVIL